MDKKSRKQELIEAIRLVGWIEVKSRVRTTVDKNILLELQEESEKSQNEQVDQKLKQAGISF
jgi:hypothetical protein